MTIVSINDSNLTDIKDLLICGWMFGQCLLSLTSKSHIKGKKIKIIYKKTYLMLDTQKYSDNILFDLCHHTNDANQRKVTSDHPQHLPGETVAFGEPCRSHSHCLGQQR